MSVVSDNKNFISNALGVASPDYNKATFGIWVTFFQNVNYSDNGYSLPQPLIEDIVASDFTVTGKRFSIVTSDGKAPKARFFLTSGIKGINGYDFLEPLAEITNTYISGYKPELLMPDMDFSGKIFRRTETLSTSRSPVSDNNVLSIQAEDWVQTNINVNATNTDEPFSYIDSGYSGYSNEVNTRYKFLYDDSGNSIENNFSVFELPIQLEQGAAYKYRISRKSEPLGQSYFVDLTSDGKGIIDNSLYKSEVSGVIEGAVSYDFKNIANITLGKAEFFEDSDKINIIKPIQNDNNITSLKISKSIMQDESEIYNLNLLSNNETFDDIYKITISFDKYKLNTKENITGYVMSSYNTGDGSSTKTISLSQGGLVYPRVSENGDVYKSKDVSDLVDIQQVIESESFAQDIGLQQTNTESIASSIGKTIDSYFQALTDALDDKYGDENPNLTDDQEIIDNKNSIEIQDSANLLISNSSVIKNESALPNFQLPKKIITSDFYSNYLNSGEKYVATPLSRYANNYCYVGYGNSYGVLGYGISPELRLVYNSTCPGIYINQTSFCNGDTATQKFRPPSKDIYYSNGLVTEIPSNGIIIKENYEKLLSWQNALNYYYTKNYIQSFDVYPSYSELEYSNLFTQAITNVKKAIGGPSSNSSSSNSFINNGGSSPRVFVEREIYTEAYDSNQDQEFNKCLYPEVLISDSEDLATKSAEKLYCVETYDLTSFARNKQTFFYPIQSYNETLTFDSFIPNSQIFSYSVDETNSVGSILFNDINPSPKKAFRIEFVTGSASTFSCNNYLNAIAWSGNNGDQISINGQDTKNYGYHLYTYTNNTGELTLTKSNIKNNDIATTQSAKAAVLKFEKQRFRFTSSKVKIPDSNGKEIEYFYLPVSINDATGAFYDTSKTKINIQTYIYDVESPETTHQWYIFNKNPINDNSYGLNANETEINPRFFEDASEESKANGEQFFLFPNGPCTSKNYEGSPVDIYSINGLYDGLFSNNIRLKEGDGISATYESNALLEFVENGKVVKQKSPAQDTTSILFNSVKRLKITKVKYNFYTKDLVLIGDAGFPNSAQFNYGWEYKLQYRIKNSNDAWQILEEKGAFNTSEISAQSSQISPFYTILGKDNQLNSLQMIAFKTNLPLYLDDGNYEFRIAKYEKMHVFSSDVDIIKKVNFIPIKVQWTADPDCQYYNIYQKDSGNNLLLLATENERNNLSYGVPDVKQSYVDLGVANFGAPNYSGFYDVVVSGIVPSVKEQSSSISGEYGFAIGNSNEQFSINKIKNQPDSGIAKAISNPTYTPLINFNNPESKNSAFVIDPNHNGYYYVSDSANASFNNILNIDFEGYVANTGASSCSVFSQSVPSNYVAIIGNSGSVSTTAIQTLPSAALDLKDVENNETLYLNSSLTINNSQSLSDVVLEICNDSSSTITITYSSNAYTIAANKTSNFSFSASSATINYIKDNITVQDDNIYYPATGFVNTNHSSVVLDPSRVSDDFPIYNISKSKLSVNSSLDLDADSFNIVNWNGSTVSSSAKEHFDSVKIFILGTESDNERTILLKDDTEVIITNFTPQETSEEYFFLKDETVTRNINISIVNGYSKYVLPSRNQDFKITVSKTNSIISYKILYPSASPFFDISEDLEQLIILSGNDIQSVNLDYLESAIPKDAFIYIINKGQSDINFYKGDPTQSTYTVSPNQIARASIITTGNANGIKIDIINSAYSHFSFNVVPASHLANSINILDLNFCGTSINFPAVSNFASKNTFLLCRNRTVPNKIDNQLVSCEAGLINTEDNPSTKEIDEKGQLDNNSIALRIYKKESTDSLPTLERTSFIKNGLLGNETSNADDVTAFFFINNDDLKTFTIRDFYNRKSSYSGKVFLPSPREMRINSFDDNHFYRTKSNSVSFDYNPDKYANGRLLANDEKDSVIISRDTENASTTKSFPNALDTNQMLINFAYDTVTVSVSSVTKTLKKNRLVKNGFSNAIYPVYNKKEFFIAAVNSQRTDSGTTLYYEIVGREMNVESIILPDSSAVITYVIKNSSSRRYPIYTLSGTLVYNIAPNSQKEFTFTGSSYSVSDNTKVYDDSIIATSIKSENQIEELDTDHPLSSLWAEGFYIDIIKQEFIGTGLDSSIKLIIDGADSTYALFDVLDTVPSSSDKIIYSYGRKSGILDIGDSKYLVNGFYLFLYYNNQIIRENEFYNSGDSFNSAGVYPLSIVEYKNLDLLKYLPTYNSVTELPDVVLLPFASQLNEYYLPNLSVVYSNNDQSYSLASLLAGKKFIFVNMVKCSKDSKNKVTNYNGNVTEELSDINSLVMYEISSGQWVKSTTGVPIVKTVYPSLDNVKGISSTQTSEIADGAEFVYLPNFSRFDITENSFLDKEFKNFYLFNSASSRIFIGSNQSMLSSNKFVRIFRDQLKQAFSSEDLQVGGSSPFSSTEVQKETNKETDTIVKEKYSGLKLGTYLKVVELVGSGLAQTKYTLFYSYSSSGIPSRVTIKNQDFVDLDLASLKNYSSNSKLFVYGANGINQDGLTFDSYYLRLLNSDALSGEKFYVYNNSDDSLKVFFKDSDSDVSQDFVSVMPRRMLEISNKASFMESHEKGSFYIGSRKTNKVFINKLGLPLFIDGLVDYQSLTGSIEKIPVVDDVNIITLNISKYKEENVYYYYKTVDSFISAISLKNIYSLSFKTINDFYLNPLNLRRTVKPSYTIVNAGHYIINNSNYFIEVDSSLLSQSLFLVNNCASNISVTIKTGTKYNRIILYRNTVLVIDTTGKTRYLKKSKRRDEFYSVFNPKTAIATQSEISFKYKIQRTEDVLPINDDNGVAQQSYVKFLSKDNSSSIIYLSLKDYYNGIDVPTDSPENIVAYEVGIGHETICKFLFFNPSESTYTLPGIVEGFKYRVDIDYSLFLNLSKLNGQDDQEASEENPFVIYNGKKYYHNDIIEGGVVSNYEVKYPNYVRVFKVTEDSLPDTNLPDKENEEIDESITQQINQPLDKTAIFYQTINQSINEAFGSLLCWIPKEEEAFWMNSNVSKNIWQIDSVIGGSTKQFVYDDRQVTFTKCVLKKTDLRSLIASTSFTFQSAIQERSVTRMQSANTPPDDLILLGDDIDEPEQRNNISKAIRTKEALQDYIVPKKEIYLGFINKDSLFPDVSKASQLKNTEFEISISVDKLKTFPTITFEDFSKSQIIKILNDEI